MSYRNLFLFFLSPLQMFVLRLISRIVLSFDLMVNWIEQMSTKGLLSNYFLRTAKHVSTFSTYNMKRKTGESKSSRSFVIRRVFLPREYTCLLGLPAVTINLTITVAAVTAAGVRSDGINVNRVMAAAAEPYIIIPCARAFRRNEIWRDSSC